MGKQKNTGEGLKQPPEQVIETVLVDRFGADNLKAWKGQFAPRKLSVVVVEDKLAVLRPITAEVIATYSMMMADTTMGGMDKATKYILEELWIDGDTCLKDDEEYFISTMLQVQNTIEVKKSAFYRI